MTSRPSQPFLRPSGRRASRLSGWLAEKKIEEARQMKPEQRLLLALELSDFCHELTRASSAKPDQHPEEK